MIRAPVLRDSWVPAPPEKGPREGIARAEYPGMCAQGAEMNKELVQPWEGHDGTLGPHWVVGELEPLW